MIKTNCIIIFFKHNITMLCCRLSPALPNWSKLCIVSINTTIFEKRMSVKIIVTPPPLSPIVLKSTEIFRYRLWIPKLQTRSICLPEILCPRNRSVIISGACKLRPHRAGSETTIVNCAADFSVSKIDVVNCAHRLCEWPRIHLYQLLRLKYCRSFIGG